MDYQSTYGTGKNGITGIGTDGYTFLFPRPVNQIMVANPNNFSIVVGLNQELEDSEVGGASADVGWTSTSRPNGLPVISAEDADDHGVLLLANTVQSFDCRGNEATGRSPIKGVWVKPLQAAATVHIGSTGI